MAKRGDRVAPPPRAGDWELQFFTTDAAKGWDELCKQARGPTREAWDIISRDPRERQNPRRQHQLHGEYATRSIGGKALEQWQFEVTGAGRIWYCPDDARRIVHVTLASCGHPSETD
jgi:hypothetical protein